MSRNALIKPTAWLLLVVMLIGGTLPSVARADDHAEVDFENMTYQPLDIAEFTRRSEIIREISGEAVNANAVLTTIGGLEKLYNQGATALALAQIYYRQDVTDNYWAGQVREETEKLQQANNIFLETIQHLLTSPCAPKLQQAWGEPLCQMLLQMKLPTAEETALRVREQELLNQYDQAYLTAFDIQYQGKSYTTTNPWQVQPTGGDQEEYWRQAFAQGNAILAPIFQELLQVRLELAQLAGYDNYLDYAYSSIYGRDYTAQEVEVMRQQVADYMVPLLSLLMESWQSGAASFMPDVDTSQEGMLQLMAKELPQIAPELTQAFSYMLNHQLYDLSDDENGLNVAYTTFLKQYGAPFMQIRQSGSYQDVLTMIHEFGHYNNYYQNADDYANWLQPVSYDLAEVHSQGLEMLFCSRYEQIWGRQPGRSIALYHLISSIDTVIQGCMEDEFQQAICANPQMSIEEMNRLYGSLKEKYQVTSLGESDGSWVLIPNTYYDPLYYISYSVSMTTALELWTMAQQNSQQAVNCYLQLVNYGERFHFRDAINASGLPDPLSSGTVKNVAQVIGSAWGYNEKSKQRFLDVYGHWAEADIYLAVRQGLFAGVEPMIFQPEEPLSRAMAVTLLSRSCKADLSGYSGSSYVDVLENAWYAPAVAWAKDNGIAGGIGNDCFGPNEPVSRQQLAAMLDNLLRMEGQRSIRTFADGETISPWAQDSVRRITALGLMNGRGNDLFEPESLTTRAEAAVIFLRLLNLGVPLVPAA